MAELEKKLAFLLATSPYLVLAWDCSYEEAARDLIANGVAPVVRCKDCKHFADAKGKDSGKPCGYGQCKWPTGIRGIVCADDFCSFGERRADNA